MVAAAGNLDHDDVVALVEPARVPAGDAAARRGPTGGETGPSQRVAVASARLEQAHLVLGMRALPRYDPDRYAFGVLNQVARRRHVVAPVPGGAGARGLAYSVFSYRAAYDETGAFAVYAGTAPERVDEVLGALDAELDRIWPTAV